MPDSAREAKKPEQVITDPLRQMAVEYDTLKRAYEVLEDDMKRRLAVLRRGMELIEEAQRIALEEVRDPKTEKAKLQYPQGTFSFKMTGRLTVEDPELLREAIVAGKVSAAIFGNDLTVGVVRDYVAAQKERVGYADLTPEQKAVYDYNLLTPPGVKWVPYERVEFRRKSNRPSAE